jgi:hypothetical protein
MKVKLFIKDKSPFRRWVRFVGDLEDDINAWLAANPGIRIFHVTQSSNGGSFDSTKVCFSIWYEEARERGAPPEWPREEGIFER